MRTNWYLPTTDPPPVSRVMHKKVFREGKEAVLCGEEGIAGYGARHVTCAVCLSVMHGERDREIESSS